MWSRQALYVVLLGTFLTCNYVSATPNLKMDNKTGCPTHRKLRVFEILPGNGWDSLRNLELGRVLALDYSKCAITQNGKYLIPDGFHAVHILATQLDLASEDFNHYKKYRQLDAGSITSSTRSMFAAAGTFSREYLDTKKTFLSGVSARRRDLKIRRLYMNHKLYSVNVVRGQAIPLSKEFQQRLRELASELMVEPTKTPSYADYLAEMIVQQFGTHYIYSTEVGGVLAKTDFMGEDPNNPYRHPHPFSAMIDSGFGLFGSFPTIDFSWLWDYRPCAARIFMKHYRTYIYGTGQCYKDGLSNFNRGLFSSKTTVLGGPPQGPSTPTSEWHSQIEDNLAVIDRRGEFLDTALKKEVLPDYPEPIVQEMQRRIREAIKRYYEHNTIKGCMNIGDYYLNPNANVDDESMCYPSSKFYNIAGVFQTCEALQMSKSEADLGKLKDLSDPCQKLRTRNTITGGYNCPHRSNERLVLEGVVKMCHTNCKKNDPSACEQVCLKLHLKTFWCYSYHWRASRGYFGGMFSQDSQLHNPLTHDYTCPVDFKTKELGSSSFLCISSSQQNYKFFGGMFSCISTNPYAGDTKDCPPGFTRYLGMVERGCELFYCIWANKLAKLETTEVKLPPFTHVTSPTRNRLVSPQGSMGTIDIDGQQWMMVKGGWKLSRNVTLKEIQQDSDANLIKRFIESRR